MLRASGQVAGQVVELTAVTEKAAGDAGVQHGARLLAFTDAAMGADDALLDRERRALCAVLSPEAFVDACALVAAFNVVDRIADSTGIPLVVRRRREGGSWHGTCSLRSGKPVV